MNKIAILLSFIILTLSIATKDYTKVIHNTDPEAKCLDGSSPMIYLHEGGDTKRFVFHLIGGGACLGTDLQSTLQSCYKRSKGEFGSSTKWPEIQAGQDLGVLSTNPQKNAFANYTKVIMIYCDGAFHQGNNKNGIKYKDTTLFFRGSVNTRSHFKYIDDKYNLKDAEKVILTGSSAGGFGVYLWHQYLKDFVNYPERVSSVADSSIFYDPVISLYPKEKALEMLKGKISPKLLNTEEDPNPVSYLVKLANTDERLPNKECSYLLTEDEQWKCFFIEFVYPTLKTPILFVESSYDQFLIEDILHFKCLKRGMSGYTLKDCGDIALNVIEVYRAQYLERFLPKLYKFGHSIWTISCCWHATLFISQIYNSELQKVPMDIGRTMRNATEAFTLKGQRIGNVDLVSWPGNTPCAY